MHIPWAGQFDLGPVYIPLAAAVIVLATGGVALTDGLDGLAGGTTALAFVAYGVIALLQEQTYLATFCFTVVGATAGFLWYNAYPARVIMGDTGALALGSSLAVVALMTGQWFILPIIGIVFVLEAFSIITPDLLLPPHRRPAAVQDEPSAPPFRALGLVRAPGGDAILARGR